ncbi:MAG: tetratricopeptide repeat protein [Anaerolineae bacterium]|nr:tetratricopeptide repeat protein [Anaerolineae bacterium]MDW8098877.1 tetratricopeptide repeat protein [Anaerolineae bacterium]
MTSKLGRFCEALIEAGWLTAIITVPLFFNVYSSRVFEPDKISLLRAIVFVMLGAWIVKQADVLLRPSAQANQPSFFARLFEWARTPLVLPTLLLALAYLVSTAFSLVPRISFWGSYQRLQGTLTTLTYMVVFGMMLGHLRRPAQLHRLLYAIILTSVPISLYGIWQRLGQDPLPWGGNVTDRVAANMGNPIFVSAYLIMAFFLTLERLADALARMWNAEDGGIGDAIIAGCGLFILIIQVTTGIVLSQSRGPFLGWIAGLYVFALLGLIILGRWGRASERFPLALRRALRWVWVAPIVLAVLLGGFLLLFNLPNSPLAGLRQESGLGRLGTILDLNTGTNRVRTLIWQGAVRLIAPHQPLTYPDGTQDRFNALRPLIGHGPESMWVAFNPFYPPELAHWEARNASPDRSHNETFDALVTTGVLGFLAYFYLFTSIFYYSLRWLGLIRTRADGRLFLGLGVIGAVGGVFAVWIWDGSLRLAGVGLPFGFIIGIVLYITLAALRASQVSEGMTGNLRSTAAELRAATDRAMGGAHPRRELLIIALLSTIVAHFVEIHFGIAIAASRTYFWALSALLVAVGMGWLSEEPVPVAVAAPVSPPTPVRSRQRARREGTLHMATSSASKASSSVWPSMWPYMLISALILVTLAYDFVTNPVRDASAWEIFWRSLTSRYVAAQGQWAPGLGIIWLVMFTWLVGGLWTVGELGRGQRKWIPSQAGRVFGAYTMGCWGAFLIFGLYLANRLVWRAMPEGDIFALVANHIAVYDGIVLAGMAILAALLWRAERALWEQGRSPYEPWFRNRLSPVITVVTLGVVAFLIVTISVHPIQADILYKQAQAFEAEDRWAESIALHQRAIELAPAEDYYYLFLGRAQLEQARRLQDAGAREQLLSQALQTLLEAQRLNPLNTDHTANLARLFRNWGELTADAQERERLWQQALAYYQTATRLSPNAAHLYNEWGLVHFLLGDLYQRLSRSEEARWQWDQALARYERSLVLDQEFPQTYLLLGDLYRTRGELSQAAGAYEKALALRPKQPQVWSALGIVYAQLGRLDDAIAASQEALRYQPNDATIRRNLAMLYEQAGRTHEALAEARRARELAPGADRMVLDQMIARLERRLAQPQ